MILYHYTAEACLEPILATGLSLGEAPLSNFKVVNAVNLTSDRSPFGHGLDMGGKPMTEGHVDAYYRMFGTRFPVGTLFPNKRQLRLNVSVPSSDRNLKRWRSWSRKHCEPGYPEHLESVAGQQGRKAKSWWLYFGVIPPSQIVAIEQLDADGSPIKSLSM